ncbi:hypothetical protein HY642_03885 [Candidatus Woesearchaeota archaeon]|nr:hypothetical protein [Candidatus Woesearchaeota archaeon]
MGSARHHYVVVQVSDQTRAVDTAKQLSSKDCVKSVTVYDAETWGAFNGLLAVAQLRGSRLNPKIVYSYVSRDEHNRRAKQFGWLANEPDLYSEKDVLEK